MISSTQHLLQQFKTLADPVRARLVAVCGVAECSVSELVQVSGQSQPRISQHVKQLCAAGILERFKDGHFVYYRVPTAGAGASSRRKLLALLPENEPQFAKDIERLREIRATGPRAIDRCIALWLNSRCPILWVICSTSVVAMGEF
jgi:ArsR family transcriptional regulator